MVDLIWDKIPNVTHYIMKYASNFDQPYTPFVQIPSCGTSSSSTIFFGPDNNSFKNKTRFTFNPADYGFNDSKYLWIKFAPIYSSGVIGPDEDQYLILPYETQVQRTIIINGIAPNAADVSNSLVIYLPTYGENPVIANEGSVSLAVSFDGNSEYTIPNNNNTNPLNSVLPNIKQLFIRGTGGSSQFSFVYAERDSAY